MNYEFKRSRLSARIKELLTTRINDQGKFWNDLWTA